MTKTCLTINHHFKINRRHPTRRPSVFFYALVFAFILPGLPGQANWIGPARLHAENRFLVLSGGGDPTSNQYSQYLQTRTLVQGLRRIQGSQALDVFFGAGNNGKTPRRLADVHSLKSQGREKRHKILYGVIEENQAATRSNLLNYFAGLGVLPADETLFLFVSDHGLHHDSYNNNCILLWYYDPQDISHVSLRNKCLFKNELRDILTRRLNARRTVFSMSQCYSGGFHQMSVETKNGFPAANPNICGFTSTTSDSIASGCTPDVDGPAYQGYERFFTEELTGRDVVTGERLVKMSAVNQFTPANQPGATMTSAEYPREGLRSMRDAHRLASLRDMTLDMPLSTSDYYLLQWARLIVNRKFTPRTNRLFYWQVRGIYARILEGKVKREDLLTLAGPGMRESVKERLNFMNEMADRVGAYDANLGRLVARGDQELNHTALKSFNEEIENLDSHINRLQTKINTLRREYILLPWREAIKQGAVSDLSGEERIHFEIPLLNSIEHRLGVSGDIQADLNTLFLVQLAAMTDRNERRAGRFSEYYSSRERRILSWAGASPERGKAADALQAYERKLDKIQTRQWALHRKKGLVSRFILMRRMLGAAVLLGAMNDTQALEDVRGLYSCERTEF